MNILLLSNYSPYTTSVLLKRGFEQAGHRVFAASSEGPPDWFRCSTRVDVQKLLPELPARPDFLMMVEASTGAVFFPQGLLECPIPTVFWAIDNHLNYAWHKAWAGMFDLTLFAQKDYVARGQNEIQSRVEWLPLAADFEWHAMPAADGLPRKRDVVFVGHLRPERQSLFVELHRVIPSLQVLSGIYGADLGRLYAQAKIGFNTSVNRDLNMRFFEVLAAGALLVTEDIDGGMRELFTEGDHFISYSREHAAQVLQYWLQQDSARQAIAIRGRERCLAHHLYRHRAKTVVDLVRSLAEVFIAERKRKIKSARLYLEMAAALQAQPFCLASEARLWALAGARRPGRWEARAAVTRYLIRLIRGAHRESFRLMGKRQKPSSQI